VFRNASGKPSTYYENGNTFPGYCTYDTKSDLLVLAYPALSYYPEALLELAHGQSKLRLVHIADKSAVDFGGGIQWNSGRLVIVGNNTDVIRFKFKPLKRRTTPEGSTAIAGSSFVRQFWIQDKRIVIPSIGSNSFNVYSYPNGKQIKTIIGQGEPNAAVVSTAPGH
jgi:hypothetical protein